MWKTESWCEDANRKGRNPSAKTFASQRPATQADEDRELTRRFPAASAADAQLTDAQLPASAGMSQASARMVPTPEI